jgi:hypothetical protein
MITAKQVIPHKFSMLDKLGQLSGRVALEISLFILGLIAIFLVLAKYAPGGPLSTDVLGYANLSLNGYRDPALLNRYFHIYFQSIFIKLAPSPLVGMQYFWAFLVAAICGLVYLAARTASKNSQVFHGLLAVGLFLAIEDFATTAGIALVDITAMFMMMAFMVIFIISARHAHAIPGLLILLGILLYLSFRTKETALWVGLPLFGLGSSFSQPYTWRLFFQRMGYVLAGVVIGLIAFIILNTVFLHDPWFGFRLSDIRIYLHSYVGNIFGYEKSPGNANWFTAYIFTGLLIPFSLFLLSAAKRTGEQESYPGMRLVWLIPLAVIVFVTITVNNQWSFIPRYIYTAIPFICFLAPQFLNLDLAAADKKQRLAAIVIFGVGLVLVSITRLAIRTFISGLGWDIWSFLVIIFIPILYSLALALSLYWKTPSLRVSTAIVVLVIGMITIPLQKNAKTIFIPRPNQAATRELFYPFSAFADQIRFSPEMQMYVSLDAWRAVGMASYCKDRDELSALFNLYFAAGTQRINFALVSDGQKYSSDLLSTSYEYALLSMGDWEKIQQDLASFSRVEQKYQVFQEDTHRLVFLELK